MRRITLLFLAWLGLLAPPLARAQTCQTVSGLPFASWTASDGSPRTLQLELLVPSSESFPAPVVVWIHGGGWFQGSRLPIPAGVSDLCSRGYAVASIDYRLTADAVWPAQIQDVKGAVRWLRAHSGQYGLDPDRIAAWGESAGGQLAAMLGVSGGRSLAAPLTVRWAFFGTTEAGPDFSGPTRPVTLPAGAASAIFSIKAVDDALAEGDETVGLTLAPDPAYRIDAAQASASLTISDNDASGSLPEVILKPWTRRPRRRARRAAVSASLWMRRSARTCRCATGCPAPRSTAWTTLLYEAGAARPVASTLNVRPGETRCNNAILPLAGAPAALAAYGGFPTGGADLVIDVTGYFR